MGDNHDLARLAEDLVRRQVAVIVTTGSEVPVLAAKTATTTIPIVLVVGYDPVLSGLIASFNRPGSNLTGIFNLFRIIGSKQLGLLHELVPSVAVIAVLANPNERPSYCGVRSLPTYQSSSRLTWISLSTYKLRRSLARS
jgi:putative tryptophan/tyrosine transport system substrate-binding protein